MGVLQDPVIVGKAVLGVLVAELLDRSVGVELAQRLGHGIGGLGVALLEAHGVVLGRKRLVKLEVGVGVCCQLIGGDGEVAGDGVDGAGLELHEGGVVLADLLERREGGGKVGLVALEDVERGGVYLGDDGLAGEVLKARDAAVGANHDDLLVEHVGLGEGVVVLAALHGEAVPDAVDGAGVEQRVLGVPVDCLILNVPAELVGDGGGKVEVEAGELAVIAYEAIGRIRLVEADDEGAGGRRAGVLGGAAGVGRAGRAGGRRGGVASGKQRDGASQGGEAGEQCKPAARGGASVVHERPFQRNTLVN